MMGAPGELHRAIHGLRKAAEAGFTGNSYYQAVNRITDLTEIVGPAEKSAAPGEDAASDFATMLAEVRKGVQSHLSGNRYYMAVNKLEELASFAKQASEAPPRRGPSFEELAAASKARVEAAAASLGIVTSRHGTFADGELERRSSEPCFMAELAPPALEPVAPAPVFAEAAAPAPLREAAQSFGSPAAQSEHGAVQGTAPSAATAHPATAAAPQHSAPAYDSKAASASQTVEAAAGQEIQGKERGEIKRKQPKTLFKLWLDLAFGRKD